MATKVTLARMSGICSFTHERIRVETTNPYVCSLHFPWPPRARNDCLMDVDAVRWSFKPLSRFRNELWMKKFENRMSYFVTTFYLLKYVHVYFVYYLATFRLFVYLLNCMTLKENGISNTPAWSVSLEKSFKTWSPNKQQGKFIKNEKKTPSS